MQSAYIVTEDGESVRDNNPLPVKVPSVGAVGNAWNAVAAGAGDNSSSVEVPYQYRVTAFGSSDAATTITAYVSQDNTTFYNSGSNQVLGGAGDFHISFETAAKYVRLKTSGAATLTATISAK